MFYRFLITFVLFAFISCKEKTRKQSNIPLISSIIPKKTHADSIVVNKAFDLTSTQFDTLLIPKGWRFKLTYKEVPFANQDKVPFGVIDTIRYKSKYDSFYYSPKVVIAKPFLSPVQHPKPIKAGDLRSTGIANENITYLGEEQGLPSSQVNCLLEDNKGFLWIGTSTGLTRYDGYNIYNYSARNGITGMPNKLLLDPKDSSIWMSTTNGLWNYDGKRFLVYTTESGLPGNSILDIHFDKQNCLWLICQETGLVKLKDGKFFIYGSDSPLELGNLYRLGSNKANEIFIGTWDRNMSKIINDTIIHRYHWQDWLQFGSGLVTNIYNDKNNNLLLGTYSGGFVKLQNDKSIRYKPNTGFPYFQISAILGDSKNSYWIGTGEGGIAKLEDNGFKLYTTKQGLTSNKISDIIEDRAGNVWVATVDGGLNKIVPGSFKLLSSLDGLSDKPIQSIYVNKKGETLFGSWGGGIHVFNGKKIKQIVSGNGLDWKIILSMQEDSIGNLFVGTHMHGFEMLKVSPSDSVSYDSLLHLSIIKSFENRFVASGKMDLNKNVWLADFNGNGLTKYGYNYFEKYFVKNGLSSNNVSCIAVDNSNDIWLAYNGNGISKISENKITHFTTSNGLPSNVVHSVFVDSENKIWIGTNKGLAIYNGKEFTLMDVKDGLSSNVILNLVEDNNKRIWAGTFKGLNCLIPSKTKPKGYLIENYNLQDGLKTNSFRSGAVAYDKLKNILWWGTNKGAIYLNLNEFNVSKKSPRTFLSHISLMDEHFSFHSLLDSVAKGLTFYNSDSTISFNDVNYTGVAPFFNYPLNLQLPYDRNTITFYFYGCDGQVTQKLNYRYKLEGFDDNWIVGKLPEVKYANLSPGKYEFTAQAKLEGLDWGESFTYRFIVKPPFWATWWFRILTLTSIIGLIVYIFKLRNKQLLERQVILEKTVTERTQEINNQKTLIEEKQKEIVDSINYAKRIQYALLSHDDFLRKYIPHHFIFFNPKDIVSGDFYWSTTINNKFYLAVCDSTGHGVPGAFMSLLSIGFLNEAIKEKNIEKPNEVFDYVRERLIENISKEGQKDGFDGILICIDYSENKITYAAANNEPLLVRDFVIIEQNKDRMPVGMGEKKLPFNLFTIEFKTNDILYLYTDGYADQFGGPKGKKFMYKKLNQLLLELSTLSLEEQRTKLQTTFEIWRGELEQVDDVCIIGIRL